MSRAPNTLLLGDIPIGVHSPRPVYTLQAGRGILKDGRHVGSIMRAGPTTDPCEVDTLARDAVAALNAQPRVATAAESMELIVAYSRHTGGDREDIAGWMNNIAVWDRYMPDGPGYAGRVAVVVWSGGANLTTTFGFRPEAFVLGESQ